MNNFIKLLIIVVILIAVLYMIYIGFGSNSLKYVKSSKDGDHHLVRDLPDKDKAANLMADIKGKIKKLLIHLKMFKNNNKGVQRLLSKFNEDNIQETDISDSGTSYSINKGKEISLCIRDKNDEAYKLHEINTIMFVTLHELAHIMSESYGHNDEFHDNFVFILKQAIAAGVYRKENYEENNKDYCGIKITSTPI